MARPALVLGAVVAIDPLTIDPLTIDMYLPALCTIRQELGTTSAQVLLTLTGTLVGLALGQLLIGPLSDSLGRRRPLVAGTALHVVASLLVLVPPVPARRSAASCSASPRGGAWSPFRPPTASSCSLSARGGSARPCPRARAGASAVRRPGRGRGGPARRRPVRGGAAVSPVLGLLGDDATAVGAVIAPALLLAPAVVTLVARPWQLPEPEEAVALAR